MKSYLVATWCPDTWTREYTKKFECFAFFCIGTQQEVAGVGQALGLSPQPWIQNNRWVVCFDHVAGQGLDDEREVKQWLNEIAYHGIEWSWSRDLIPGAPDESMEEEKAAMNTFATYEEFMQALSAPIDMKAGWVPDTYYRP